MLTATLVDQKTKYRVPKDRYLSVADYAKSLPTPPVGSYWERLDDRTWDLKTFEREKTSEPESVVFSENANLVHVVMPGDTLQGICLRYRVGATELRRFNVISSNNIQCLRELKIPVTHNQPITIQVEDNDVTLQRFKNATGESREESLIYLEDSGFNLEKALMAWRADEAWSSAAGPALAANVFKDIHLTPEEVANEQAQRQLPGHLVVFPSRIIFVDSAEAVPPGGSLFQPSSYYAREVAPHWISETPARLSVASSAPAPAAPLPSAPLGPDSGDVYEPLLARNTFDDL